MATLTLTQDAHTLWAETTLGTNTVSPVASYIALGTGAGTTSADMPAGTYTSIPTNALNVALSANQVLTLTNGSQSVQVMVGAAGAAQGATSIPITSVTTTNDFPAGSGVVATASDSDHTLQNETYRAVITSSNAGGSTGESVYTLYLAPSDGAPSQLFLEAALFAGNATSAANSGTMLGRGVISFSYTANVSGANLTFDLTQ